MVREQLDWWIKTMAYQLAQNLLEPPDQTTFPPLSYTRARDGY